MVWVLFYDLYLSIGILLPSLGLWRSTSCPRGRATTSCWGTWLSPSLWVGVHSTEWECTVQSGNRGGFCDSCRHVRQLAHEAHLSGHDRMVNICAVFCLFQFNDKFVQLCAFELVKWMQMPDSRFVDGQWPCLAAGSWCSAPIQWSQEGIYIARKDERLNLSFCFCDSVNCE